MAQLQLQPNIIVLLIQGGMFLGAVALIRRLFVQPYLAIQAKRDQATTGNTTASESMQIDNEKREEKISQTLAKALQESQASFEAAKAKALSEKQSIIGSAEEKAQERLAGVESHVRESLAAEQAKIPQVVNELRSQIMAKALN